MVSCSVRGCKNRGRRGNKVTYHVFPKNGEVRQKWIPVTGRKNWTPAIRAVVCSDHFEEPCFDRTGQTTRLRVGAIPTIGKFAPKNKKAPIFMNMELDNHHHQPHPVTKTVSVKAGITTRSGRQLSPRRIPAAAGATIIKKELCEFEEEVVNYDGPPAPPAPPASEPANGNRTGEATTETPPTAHPDHFYCRTQSEMDALLKKSEQKIEYLKMKLDYLNSPDRSEKQEPPDWPQYRRELLQQEADEIRAMVKAGKKPVINIKINSEDLTDGDEQLKERQKEAEDLQRQIKTLQQKSRRQKSKSKAKFIRCVVMIEPTSKSGKKGTAVPGNALHEGEKEAAKETEVPPVVDKVSSLHDSILSHTASMVVGPNGLLNEKDKKIRDLQKKLKIAKLKEKRRMEQLEHLQEVIEFLKERCPEYSSQKEPMMQRHCSLCHSPLLKRCHGVAEYWAAPKIIEDQFSVPLLQFKPEVCHAVPLSQLKSHGPWSLKKQHWPWVSNGSPLCFFCRALVQRGRLKQRSLVHSLRPQC